MIAPSILDNFIADLKLNKVLFSSKEAIESLLGYKTNDLLRPLSDFTPILVSTHFKKTLKSRY